MNKRPRVFWTTEEDEKLRQLVFEGRSRAIIAERLKRSPTSIRNRVNVLAEGQERKLLFDPSPDLPGNTPIGTVRMPARVRNALIDADFHTVGEIRESPDKTLLSLQ